MKVTRWPNTILHKSLEKIPHRVGSTDPQSFEAIFERYDKYDLVWVHIGLSDVNRALPGNPYENVMNALRANFENILATGFTHYFRKSRVYDKQHSRPGHGTFVRLFFNDADYRTNDAIKSILVKGEYRFDECNHRNTYSKNGCFEQVKKDNALTISIGTPWLICSYLHHIEANHGAPYMPAKEYKGVMHDNGSMSEITQTTQMYDGIWTFNKFKLQRHLRAAGILDEYDLNGLSIYAASIPEIDTFVSGKMKQDPYYLVT